MLMQRHQYSLVRFSWGEFYVVWVAFAWLLALSMLRVGVRGLPGHFLDKALTMSSWSLVVATMQDYVSIGLCAIFGEISDDWVTSRGFWRSQC